MKYFCNDCGLPLVGNSCPICGFNQSSKKETIKCSNCNKELEDNFCYKVLDNNLQTKYFDNEEENRFCSKECVCDYISVEQVEIQED